MKTFNYVYIIKNITNNKQYVGDHSTNDLNDNYLGSGFQIKKDIKKYGREIFEREILEQFKTKQEAFNAQEKYIRLYKTHISQGGYNLNWTGGQWPTKHSEKTKEKLKKARIGKKPNLGKKHSKETKEKISKNLKGKTSHRKYILIDPRGIEYKNIVLQEICKEKNLNFDTIRKHTNKGIIKTQKTKNINKNTLNCDGWEVIREDKQIPDKRIIWILINPKEQRTEIFLRDNFQKILDKFNIDYRTLHRFKNKGKIKIKNKSLSSKRTLNTEGWEAIHLNNYK